MANVARFWEFFSDILKSRSLILELARRDLKVRYLGSFLGVLWAFVQPAVTVLIFWFVFQVGFKSPPVGNFPYILWLLSGLIPWFFISDCINNATVSVISNTHLVKKVVFRVSILPIVNIVSALIVHLFFIGCMFLIFLVYGYFPTLYSLQLFYYLLATTLLVLGISWITSSIIIFARDIGQIINMFLQFAFWLTPIFWMAGNVPERYRFFIKLNPFNYIVDGYRNTFIYHKWFWEVPYQTVFFWLITITLVITGATLFKKLRPHFADIL